MVAFNMLWKLCVIVAFGLSTTVTSTEVAKEQPKKESLESGSLRKKELTATKPVEVQKEEITESEESTEAKEPPKFSVDWYLLPRPMNRACLRRKLPFDLYYAVPKNCNEPISPKIEKRIKSFFSSSPLNQSLRQSFSYYCST